MLHVSGVTSCSSTASGRGSNSISILATSHARSAGHCSHSPSVFHVTIRNCCRGPAGASVSAAAAAVLFLPLRGLLLLVLLLLLDAVLVEALLLDEEDLAFEDDSELPPAAAALLPVHKWQIVHA
jgi:hypothetical protein